MSYYRKYFQEDTMSRSLDDLIPSMKAKALDFKKRMEEAGITFMFTCTYRTQAEQNELWKIGRNGDKRPKVTWTTLTRHTAGDAFDIAIVKDKKPTWDLKVSVNKNEIPDYFEAGKIGESIGLVWGGRWEKHPDYPHFQETE